MNKDDSRASLLTQNAEARGKRDLEWYAGTEELPRAAHFPDMIYYAQASEYKDIQTLYADVLVKYRESSQDAKILLELEDATIKELFKCEKERFLDAMYMYSDEPGAKSGKRSALNQRFTSISPWSEDLRRGPLLRYSNDIRNRIRSVVGDAVETTTVIIPDDMTENAPGWITNNHVDSLVIRGNVSPPGAPASAPSWIKNLQFSNLCIIMGDERVLMASPGPITTNDIPSFIFEKKNLSLERLRIFSGYRRSCYNARRYYYNFQDLAIPAAVKRMLTIEEAKGFSKSIKLDKNLTGLYLRECSDISLGSTPNPEINLENLMELSIYKCKDIDLSAAGINIKGTLYLSLSAQVALAFGAETRPRDITIYDASQSSVNMQSSDLAHLELLEILPRSASIQLSDTIYSSKLRGISVSGNTLNLSRDNSWDLRTAYINHYQGRAIMTGARFPNLHALRAGHVDELQLDGPLFTSLKTLVLDNCRAITGVPRSGRSILSSIKIRSSPTLDFSGWSFPHIARLDVTGYTPENAPRFPPLEIMFPWIKSVVGSSEAETNCSSTMGPEPTAFFGDEFYNSQKIMETIRNKRPETILPVFLYWLQKVATPGQRDPRDAFPIDPLHTNASALLRVSFELGRKLRLFPDEADTAWSPSSKSALSALYPPAIRNLVGCIPGYYVLPTVFYRSDLYVIMEKASGLEFLCTDFCQLHEQFTRSGSAPSLEGLHEDVAKLRQHIQNLPTCADLDEGVFKSPPEYGEDLGDVPHYRDMPSLEGIPPEHTWWAPSSASPDH
jgi:hypothetical protein